MFKNFKAILLFIIGIGIFSSCSENKSVQLTADLSPLNADQVIMSNRLKTINDTINLVDQKLDYTIEVSKPEILNLNIGNASAQIYVIPGSKLNLSYAAIEREFSFVGETANENITIGYVNKLMREANSKNPTVAMAMKGEHEFVELLNKKYGQVIEYLESQKVNISSDVYDKLVARINSGNITDMLRFPAYYEYANGEKPDLTPGYTEQVDQVKFEDPSLLDFSEGITMGRAMVEKDVDFVEIGSVPKYYAALIDQVDLTFTNPTLREYYKHLYLLEKISVAGGLDGIENQLEEFLASSKNKILIDELNKEASQWMHLKQGLQAPEFTGVTRDGSLVKLSDLKGKNVYVDVWATWCGPCIREIPSLKEVEHDYENKNITFISISIDKASDKEKWEKFIEERELGGTQLFADGEWNSEIALAYNIKGIPRFLLIDESGKIVKADAPRPSNPELREMFSEMGI